MRIEFNNFTYKYRKNSVINNLNLIINDNDYIIIKGSNGSGKTTLIKNITKELISNKNQLFLDGKDINLINRPNISYLEQSNKEFNYDFPITASELLLSKLLKKDMNQVTKYLKMVKLYKYKDTDLNQLSGGELQRLFIARLLLSKNKTIILDEPFVGLDKENIDIIKDILINLNKDGYTIILISHNVLSFKQENIKIFNMDIKEFE